MVAMAADATPHADANTARGRTIRYSGATRNGPAMTSFLSANAPVGREVRRMTTLATPTALAQLLSMLLWTVDVLMVGHVGVDALNAVSLGRLWLLGTGILGMGLVYGLDALASQAHGARDRARLGGAL